MELTICCPEGGDHPVEARLARVVVDEQARAYVEFPCGGCGRYVSCPLEDASALRLIALGVRASAARAPAEVVEVHDGPPITPDDLLDLHLFLAQPNWIEHLEQELNPKPEDRRG